MSLSYRCFKTFVCIIALMFVAGVCLGQQKPVKPDSLVTPDIIIKRIADSLESMTGRLPIEKVYIHTDKDFYDIGDTIWLKAYVLDDITHLPSRLSNILYIQMDDDTANVIDRISIRIKDGVGWGQMPLRKTQYIEGNHTMRAYTSWMQNFGYDFIFNKHFYLSTPVLDTWMIKTKTEIAKVDDKNQLKVSLLVNKMDKQLSPLALKDVGVRLYDENHYSFSQKMRTGIDGSLEFSGILKDKMDGRRIRAQITSLEPKDNNKTINVPLIINRAQKIDLQFLPEGGKLVGGIKSVVGFKAVSEDGRGADVSGRVYDSKGNKVAAFKAFHNGMGTFEFTPKESSISQQTGLYSSSYKPKPAETYTARIDEPQGITEEYPLPKVEPLGTVIHVDHTEKAADLKITISGFNSMLADSGFYLVATMRGNLYYSQKIDISQTEFSIAKSLFPTGIAKITLFKGLTPLNERSLFIDHREQLAIKITPDKLRYGKRDSVSLAIEVKDKDGNPVQGNFSLSVTDNSLVAADSTGDHHIATSLLIGDNLKNSYSNKWDSLMKYTYLGEVESPGYYINRTDDKAWQALDNLMLTQGWADYDWRTQVFNPVKGPFFGKEQNTLDVTGRVIDPLTKLPVAQSQVLVSSQMPAFVSVVKPDKTGTFVLKDLLKLDSGSFFLQALKPNGKIMRTGEVIVDRPLHSYIFPPTNRFPILPWYVNSDTTAVNLAKRRAEQALAAKPQGPGTVLNEVKIKGKKAVQGSWNIHGAGNADYVFDEHDIKQSGLTNLYDFLFQKIPGLRISHASYANGGKFLVLFRFNGNFISPNINGLKMETFGKSGAGWIDPVEELSKYQLSSIRGIEFAFSHKYTKGYEWVFAITTYSGEGGVRHVDLGATSYKPLPVTNPKIFYSPKYHIQTASKLADYRATIHWEPNITTDKNGKATVSFYTSDAGSNLSFNIQGFSGDGSIGSLFMKLPEIKRIASQ